MKTITGSFAPAAVPLGTQTLRKRQSSLWVGIGLGQEIGFGVGWGQWGFGFGGFGVGWGQMLPSSVAWKGVVQEEDSFCGFCHRAGGWA